MSVLLKSIRETVNDYIDEIKENTLPISSFNKKSAGSSPGKSNNLNNKTNNSILPTVMDDDSDNESVESTGASIFSEGLFNVIWEFVREKADTSRFMHIEDEHGELNASTRGFIEHEVKYIHDGLFHMDRSGIIPVAHPSTFVESYAPQPKRGRGRPRKPQAELTVEMHSMIQTAISEARANGAR